MLEPQDRRLLFDLLRPPLGYRLDRAISTTFSLDLMTLITLPLAFTLFDMQGKDDRPTADPNALLEAVRRCAGRITVFCQSGRICVPKRGHLLLGYLEDSVFQVTAPRGGVFHPKVTVLRFEPHTLDDSPLEEFPVIYRLICASRNLTFDRSWDTALLLEGALTKRAKDIRRNRPLGDFVAQLPRLAMPSVPESIVTQVATIGEELLRVDFQPPDGFEDEIVFHPMGLGDRENWPFEDAHDQLLIVSPFVGDTLLTRLAKTTDRMTLVSRFETLEQVRLSALRKADANYYLAPEAETGDGIDGDGQTNPPSGEQSGEDNSSEGQEPPTETVDLDYDSELNGLHAKLYIADIGTRAIIWTGSANATEAAFSKNVEFLVELQGPRRKLGVDAVLGDVNKPGDARTREATFADLLREYARSEEPIKTDETQQRLDKLVEDARSAIALAGLTAEATLNRDGDKELYRVELRLPESVEFRWPADVLIQCWPITIREELAVIARPSTGRVLAAFESLTFQALTAFFAFYVTAEEGQKRAAARFVLNLPLRGAPADRASRLLLAMLSDKTHVLRYLLMLLADDEMDIRQTIEAVNRQLVGRNGNGGGPLAGLPLLEPMLKALHRNPAKLDAVAKLVEDLKRTERGRSLLPDGFDDVWLPIWEARGSMTHE